ncbi:MAG: putative sulfate exporter family transporter, partial [Gammaproteobacteria bacterium]
MKNIILGITLSALLALGALWLATLFPSLVLSPLIIGVLLGLGIGNIFGKKLHHHIDKGLGIGTKQILRLGVILYGFRITVDGLFAI